MVLDALSSFFKLFRKRLAWCSKCDKLVVYDKNEVHIEPYTDYGGYTVRNYITKCPKCQTNITVKSEH